MPILMDILNGRADLIERGYAPLMVVVNVKTKERLEKERTDAAMPDGKLLGMDIRTEYLADGVVRFLVDEKTAPEFAR